MTSMSSGRNLPVLPNNHGPQTDRLVYGLGPFQGYDSGDPTSREVGLYDQPFVDTLHPPAVERRADHRRPVRRSLSARREGHLRSRQPEPRRSRRHPRRAPAAGEGRVHRLQRLLDRARGADRATSSRTAFRTTARSSRTRPTACCASGRASAGSETQTVDAEQHHHRPQGLRRLGAGRPQRAAALQRRPRRHAAPDALPAHQPAART